MRRVRPVVLALLVALAGASFAEAQTPPAVTVLQPARVYDGTAMHEGWGVVVRGRTIEAAGPIASLAVPAGAARVALPGLTLMPGLIEGHSHLLLHPYNETTWNDQVLKESVAYRVARATVQGTHVRARAACGGQAEVSPPPPGLEDKDVATEPKPGTESAILVQRDEWETGLSVHSASCVVAMTAWFDLNENGKVDDGEYVGVLPSREIRDRGLCAGDVTVAPPVTLAAHHP